MHLEATDLRDAIAGGVRSVVHRSVQMAGERSEAPPPEYLTTASLCFSLCDFAEPRKLLLKIRTEEQTSGMWASCFTLPCR